MGEDWTNEKRLDTHVEMMRLTFILLIFYIF